MELSVLVNLQVVAFEESADAKSDLSFRPVFLELLTLLSDEFEVGSTVLDDAFDQFLVHLSGPVVALLHVEVLKVERSVLKENVLVGVHEHLSHLDDVVAFVCI